MEVAVAVIVQHSTEPSGRRLWVVEPSAVERQTLSVLAQLCLQALYLGAEETILLIRGIRRLFKLMNLGLEILEMLLFPLSEGSLRCPVLRFAFLAFMSVLSRPHALCRRTYRRGL